MCEEGNRKKASTSKGAKGKIGTYGSNQHVDFKISNIAGTDDVLVLMGSTDECTNEIMLYPMERRSEVLQQARQLKVDIRDRGGTLQHIHTDNDSVLVSKAFREFLLEDPAQLLSVSFCPPHHHGYNGTAESCWNKLKPMACKFIATLALVIGHERAVTFWPHAYLAAADVINRRPFKRHGSSEYSKSPMELRTGVEPDMHKMMPFGAKCTVHDHYADAHDLLGRSGVILNSAPRHDSGVWNVLMLDTKRVIQTIDITLTPEEGQSVLSFSEVEKLENSTLMENYDLPDADQTALEEARTESHVPALTIEPSGTPLTSSVTPTGKNLFDVRVPQLVKPSNAPKPMVKKTKKGNQYTAALLRKMPDAILRLDNSKIQSGKSTHISNRGRVVQDLTVGEAVGMKIKDKNGGTVSYGYGDMAYDLNTTANPMYLEHEPGLPDAAIVHAMNLSHDLYGNDNWINEMPAEVPVVPKVEMFDYRGHMPDSYFDDRSQAYLKLWGDVAPVGFVPDHHIAIEWGEGNTEVFVFKSDYCPHGFKDKPVGFASSGDTSPTMDSVKSQIKSGLMDFNKKPPRNLKEVHRLPNEQRLAVLTSLQKEYSGLWDRGMFCLEKVSNLKPGQPVFPTTTVFTMKFLANGKFDRAKSRVCVRGDLMIPDRDFGEVQSPTVLCDSVKLMVSDCPVSSKVACTSDIQQAFTYGEMDPTRPMYIKQFPGTQKILDEDTGEELVMKLLFRLYGDPAAPRAFHSKLHGAYMDFSYKNCCFTQSKADPCVYYLKCDQSSETLTKSNWSLAAQPVSKFVSYSQKLKSLVVGCTGVQVDSEFAMDDGTMLTSAIFVDDSINTFNPGSNAHEVYLAFMRHLKTKFTMKDDCDGMDIVNSFLGMNFTWSEKLDWVRIDQPHAIKKLVQGSDVDITKPHFTPLPPGTEVMLLDCPEPDTPEGIEEARLMKQRGYRNRIGELLWIARSSRPDISAAVGRLATVAHNPGFVHWDLTSYLIQYLHHTRHLGIVYQKGKSDYPYCFVDVAFSPHYGWSGDDFRSFMGWIIKCAGGPISWGAKFQKALALSSSESEYYGLTAAAIQAVHITQLCNELGIYSDEPFLIYEDNKAAIKMSENSSNSKRTIHLDRRAHFIRSQVNQNFIQLEYCPTKVMEADAMTKMLPRPAFEFLREAMGLTYDHAVGMTPRVVDLVSS